MGEIDGFMAWIFIAPAESCVLAAGDCVTFVEVHSLIDLAVSQCNRSFCYVGAVKRKKKKKG